ncbi:MAG: hypothetical protein ABEL97_07760 [Salinibacter sp.]
MTQTPPPEETAIFATYTTRRDAEVARDYLDDAGIRTFVRADDAGGMHPQLQRAHGVKLVGMRGAAPRAREMLAGADLLPDDGERAASPPESPVDAEGVASSVKGGALLLSALAVVLVLLMILLG